MSTLLQKLDIELSSPPAPSITWVHISDLHFGHGRQARHRIDQQMVAQEIINDCRRLTNKLGKPDAVFFTGDVAFQGDPSNEYPQAEQWLHDLLSTVGVSQDRLFVIPGNHDVDRKIASAGVSNIAIHKFLRESPEKLDDLLESHEDLDQIWPKLTSFSNFAKVYAAPPLTPSNPYWAVELETIVGQVMIVGLNTTILSLDNSDGRSTLALGLSQIRKAIHQVPNDTLIFILMHHPPDWLYDGKKLDSVLQSRPHILLCGHVHDQNGLVESPLQGHGLLRLVAGAGHVDEKYPPEHSYSWGQLSSNGLHYFPRIWLEKYNKFRGDRNAFESMDDSGRVRLLRDRLPPALSRWIPTPDPIFVSGVVEWLNDPRGHWHLRVEGTIDEFDKNRLSRITTIIRELSKDVNVTLVAIAAGSVSLIFEGSQAGFDQIYKLFQENKNELSKRLNITILALEQVKGATLHASSLPGDVISEDTPSQNELLFLSEPFHPVLPAGIQLVPERSSNIHFIFTTGDDNLTGEDFRKETKKILGYFQAALAIDNDNHFVNLSAFESNRMISKDLAKTQLGKDMLRTDCLLKRLSASLIHPDTDLGKAYWDAVFSAAKEEFGTSDIPVSPLFKVWIEPETMVMYVHTKGKDPGNGIDSENFNKFIEEHVQYPEEPSVYVSDANIKVKCEKDFTATNGYRRQNGDPAESDLALLDDICVRLYQEMIVPVVEQEINKGRAFATVRQIYHAMGLAIWCKQNYSEDRHLSPLIDAGPTRVEWTFRTDEVEEKVRTAASQNIEDLQNEFYLAYLRLFKEGVFRYVDRHFDSRTGRTSTRTYVTGAFYGFNGAIISASLKKIPRATSESLVHVELNAIDDKALELDQGIDAQRIRIDRASASEPRSYPMVEQARYRTRIYL